MTTALSHLRAALEQHFVDRSSARLWALRSQGSAWTPLERQRAHFLLSTGADDALAEVEEGGLLVGSGLQRLRAQLGSARQQLRLAEAATRLATVLRTATDAQGALPADLWKRVGEGPDPAARVAALRLLSSTCGQPLLDYLRACHRLSAEPPALLQPEYAQQRERAAALLTQTETVASEIFRQMAAQHSERGRPSLSGLWHGLRASACDKVFSPRRRMTQVARFTADIGLQRQVSRHLRVESDRFTVWPGGILPLSVPDDLRITESSAIAGPQAEAAALAGVGAGLALSLMPRHLPVEDRWPLPDGPASALAGLCLQWLPDPVYLRVTYGVSGKELEAAQRAAAAAVLFLIRLSCHFALMAADAPPHDGGADLGERLAGGCRELLHVPVQPLEVGLLALSPEVAHGRALGHLCGLRLHGALRERLDEDFFRNPRFAEVVQIMTARGHQMTTADLETELGACDEDPTARILEWF